MVYKHPEERSVQIGIWTCILFGAWGAHRFYIGERKAGFIILILTAIAVLSFIFNLRVAGILMVFALVILLFEILTIYPRILRHNELLTKHYHD